MSVTIGRLPDNDIVLENRAVSGRHAEIEGTEHGFYIADFHSKNGLKVLELSDLAYKKNKLYAVGDKGVLFTFALEIKNDLIKIGKDLKERIAKKLRYSSIYHYVISSD